MPFVLAATLCLTVGAGNADTIDNLIERLDRLEEENWQLRKEIDVLKAEQAGPDVREETAPHASASSPVSDATSDRFLKIDWNFSYEILDPTSNINRKQRLSLERRQEGTLAPDSLYVEGAVTAITDYQSSNRADKFAYLMRHPTAANQVGHEVSEATIHSSQLGFTAMPSLPTSLRHQQPLEFL